MASTARPRDKRDSAGAFGGRNRTCSTEVGLAPRPAEAKVWSQGPGPSLATTDDPYRSPARHRSPFPLTAEEGRRAQQGGSRHRGRTHAPRTGYRVSGARACTKERSMATGRHFRRKRRPGGQVRAPLATSFYGQLCRLPGAGRKTSREVNAGVSGAGRRGGLHDILGPRGRRESTQSSLEAPGEGVVEHPMMHQRPGGCRVLVFPGRKAVLVLNTGVRWH